MVRTITNELFNNLIIDDLVFKDIEYIKKLIKLRTKFYNLSTLKYTYIHPIDSFIWNIVIGEVRGLLDPSMREFYVEFVSQDIVQKYVNNYAKNNPILDTSTLDLAFKELEDD